MTAFAVLFTDIHILVYSLSIQFQKNQGSVYSFVRVIFKYRFWHVSAPKTFYFCSVLSTTSAILEKNDHQISGPGPLKKVWVYAGYVWVYVWVYPQLCPTLCDLVDCSLPGSSVHGILQARMLEWGCHFLLQEIFPVQGLNLGLPCCRQTLYCLSHQGSCWSGTKLNWDSKRKGTKYIILKFTFRP